MLVESTITCPHRAAWRIETMPENACQVVSRCRGCGETLRPRPGECCVFCSYGTVPCPPIQIERA